MRKTKPKLCSNTFKIEISYLNFSGIDNDQGTVSFLGLYSEFRPKMSSAQTCQNSGWGRWALTWYLQGVRGVFTRICSSGPVSRKCPSSWKSLKLETIIKVNVWDFAKGHLISKAIYDLLTFSKKRTNLIWFVSREE